MVDPLSCHETEARNGLGRAETGCSEVDVASLKNEAVVDTSGLKACRKPYLMNGWDSIGTHESLARGVV